MVRRFALLAIVLTIGVIGGAIGQSRLSAAHHVTPPRRAVGMPRAASPMLTLVTPPPTLAELASREAAFNAAPAQEVVLGKATNDVNEK